MASLTKPRDSWVSTDGCQHFRAFSSHFSRPFPNVVMTALIRATLFASDAGVVTVPMFTANHDPGIYLHWGINRCVYIFFPLCFFFAIQLPACGATASKVMPLHNCISLRNILFCKTYSFVFSHNVLLHMMQHFHLIFLQAATLAAAC